MSQVEKAARVMSRIVSVSDVLALLLVGAISCTLARPLEYEKLPGSSKKDFITGLEYRDLLPAANSPVKRHDVQKPIKNASGKSDEGGYYKTYGSDAEGEKGYVKQTYSNGDHGYKTLDTFHKKAGDDYGFEKHTGFGKARGAKKGGRQAKSNAYKTKANDDEDHEGAGTIVDTYYAEDDGDNAAYREAEEGGNDFSGESASYTDGGDNEHYTAEDDGDEAQQYNEGSSDSGNYGNSDGYNEHYSRGGGNEGSYGSHGSYTSGDDGDGFHGGEYY